MLTRLTVNSDHNPDATVEEPISKETVSKASSELNNLLQIISGTSAEIANLWEGKDGSDKYLSMLRESISRAEAVADQLAEQAGGTNRKTAIHPELASFAAPKKNVAAMPISKPQVLVVDDEEVALMLLKQLLTNAGYQVGPAQSGFECLDVFRRRPLSYRLVILDLTMPFMDGEETFHRLREINPDVTVMLCTGFIQNERLEKLMAAGLSGFLRKPFAPEEILGQIQALLDSVKYARVTGESPSLTA